MNHTHRLAAVLLAAGNPPIVVAQLLKKTEGWVKRLNRQVIGFPDLLALEQNKHLDRVRELAAEKPFNLREAVEGTSREVFDGKMEMARQREDIRVANAALDSMFDRLLPKKQQKEERTASLHITLDQKNLIIQTLQQEGITVPDLDTPEEDALLVEPDGD